MTNKLLWRLSIGLACLLDTHDVLAQTQDTTLVINEIQTANLDQFIDNSYNYGGWIELYNPTSSSIILRGMYITDGTSTYRLLSAQGSVPAGGYKTLWFDHNSSSGSYGSKASLQVPYKLEFEGGTISLLSSAKDTIASVTYPEITPRCSYARLTDGANEWGITSTPTPNASNKGSKFAVERLDPPEVDVDSHVFTDPFTVRVTVPRGTLLKYTTDGSTPSATHGTTSSAGRLNITKTTILRFCLVADGYLPSAVVTRSYIYRNHDYYLPVISVSTDPKNLYDDTIGIYTRGTNGVSGNGQGSACNWNMDWERPVNFEYLIPEKDEYGNVTYIPQVNQEIDMEISGGWTRAYGGGVVDGKYWEMKSSFRVKTDKRYEGVNSIDCPVFPDKPYNKYRCWQVRNGGNDTYARIIDPALQQIVMKSGFYVDCQDYQPAHVFFNGEYVGMFNIRESNNKHYGYSNYGIDAEDMDQFDLSNAQYNQKVGDNKAWLELVKLALQLSSKKTPELYQQICDRLDIDEYINYMALECYVGPSDWITNTNNVKGFRSRSDGKFHFVLFDLDSAFSTDNMLSDVLSTSGGANVDDLFRYLMKYDPFRRQFMDAYCLVDGSVFEPGRCEAIVRGIYDNTNYALSFEGNSSNLGLVGTINAAHNGSRIGKMSSVMGVGDGYYLRLSSNIPEARLQVNGQEVPTGKFAGYLFSYKGEPVNVTAKAPAGYRFGGWMHAGNTETSATLIPLGAKWKYYDQGSMDGYDWKQPDFDETRYLWRSGTAPFGYANEGMYMAVNAATTLDYGDNSANKRPTYYFRNTFQLDAVPSSNSVVTLDYQVDDGMMLYVNGVEVGGYYVASGSPYSSYTKDGHFEGSEPYRGSIVIPNELLKAGANQIAVEVKNTSATSTDIFFEASLSMVGVEENMLPATESLNIVDLFEEGTKNGLTAVFTPIEGERQRWELGATPIRINEVSAGNDIYISDYGKKSDWLELYNTTDEDIDLAGMYLSDNGRNGRKYRLAEGTVPANGTCIVWCDGRPSNGQLHAPFKLDNADGACVSIMASDGTWCDRVDYLEQDRWQTYGRYPDGGNAVMMMNQPTIDRSNTLGMADFLGVAEGCWQGTDMAITLALEKGWNWTSHNLSDAVDRNRFTTYADLIVGYGEEYPLSQPAQPVAELEVLSPAAGYKVRMGARADITLRGALFDTSTPVVLREGWNWIGFPLYNATTLDAALSGYEAQEGDALVGLDAFAIHDGTCWRGSLTSLSPGQSYLMYSGRGGQFCWQSLSLPSARSRRYVSPLQAEDAAWQVDIHAYPDVMSVVAEVKAGDGISLAEGSCYVGAFCGGECRGVGVWNDGLLFVNVHGDGPEPITFRLLDAEGGCYGSPESPVFQAQALLGSCAEPYVLSFYTDEILDGMRPDVSEGNVVREVWYNMAGQRVSRPVSGVYVRQAVGADGRVTSRKVTLP